ncbi:TrkH family potassium uptake protein [Gordonia sp. (in: high G+C Gram-positive bacteria)]|uniref:TrkH family potassium uptake protein n=1 Tax=Gordonia sp. (in: high G+C Gram-positive bacteria) TaxID=84139 RepID=UPI003C773B30
MLRARGRRPALRPPRLIAMGFIVVILVGTVLLSLPVASADGTRTEFVAALFTATSATCVTGLTVVDTATHWSTFGEVVILLLIQIGGLGVMTLATLLGLLVVRKVGLRMQMAAQVETKSVEFGDGRKVILRVIGTSLVVEAVIAVVLAIRFWVGYSDSPGRAAYLGVFHAVSAFNNAGFALFSDNVMGFVGDPWIIVPLAAGLVIGGLGFPVLYELRRAWRRARLRMTDRTSAAPTRPWFSLHVRMTLIVYAALAVIGIVVLTASEWNNAGTLGPLSISDKLLGGMFAGLSPRTAGFNSIDVGAMTPGSLLVTDILMFIGGGSGGTAGGIKVTTFAILGYVILSEIRGEPSVHAMKRRIAPDVQRQAVTVALLGVGAVMSVTLLLQALTPFSLDQILVETVSAFATVGLSTGITASIPASGQLLLVALMLLGRLGPITLASALALRERVRRFERPEERPIVG